MILEPAAAAGLINFMMFSFDARQADEGRSFLAKKGGGNRLGEKVYDERVEMWADPWDPQATVLPLPWRPAQPAVSKARSSGRPIAAPWTSISRVMP